MAEPGPRELGLPKKWRRQGQSAVVLNGNNTDTSAFLSGPAVPSIDLKFLKGGQIPNCLLQMKKPQETCLCP